MYKLLAWLISRKPVADWLIKEAMKTPYFHIMKGDDVYMERYWLFNPYKPGPDKQERAKYAWCPFNVRVHWIRRPDSDEHLHDHPWNIRTFILRGWYVEQRDVNRALTGLINREVGDTASLHFGQYHRIAEVAPEGAWTLFVSGPYQGTWGFLVNGVKVNWRKYLNIPKPE